MGNYYLLLVFFYMVLSVRSCDSSRMYGCSSPSEVFGGRLLFTGKSGLSVANHPSWIAGRKIIFLQENFPAGPTSGTGQIWTGRRGCSHGFCQPTYTNSALIRPCVKNRHSMCDDDLTLDLVTESIMPNQVRLVANWTITDKPSCEMRSKELIIQQKDRDGCTNSLDSLELQRSIPIEALTGVKNVKMKYPNSLYEVTLKVTCGAGDTYRKSVEIRTAETAPTSAPTNLTQIMKGKTLIFQWSEPPCGKRNGNIGMYEVVFKMHGRDSADRTTNNKKFYFGVERDSTYTFKVRAETDRGRGPFTKPITDSTD